MKRKKEMVSSLGSQASLFNGGMRRLAQVNELPGRRGEEHYGLYESPRIPSFVSEPGRRSGNKGACGGMGKHNTHTHTHTHTGLPAFKTIKVWMIFPSQGPSAKHKAQMWQ
ncbi:hypothetical protein KUCAC02_033689 [Chaenocephalus aceratus]|nr:hypothetical protein KUCAC02_033689 [Chaenocephalus aceratus]